jgi:hypothetical protein
LAPRTEGPDASVIKPKVILESDLLNDPLEPYDVIVLCNVSQVTAEEERLLRDYLKRGGGVLFFLGPQTDLQAYNQTLYAEGKGIFPALLEGVVDLTGDDPSFVSFDPLEYSHPVVELFAQHEQSGLLSTKIHRYIRATAPKGSEAEIALAYSSGDSAIVVKRVERGRVAAITTTADLSWNTWALSPSYLPVMQQLLRQLAAGANEDRQYRAGDPVRFPLPRNAYDARVQVTGPDPNEPETQRPIDVTLNETGDVQLVAFDDTQLAGVYQAKIESPIAKEWSFAVNPWPEESDLERIDEPGLREKFPGWEFTLLDRWESAQARSSAGKVSANELHRPLLYLALLLLFVETYFAWRFNRPI